MSSFDELKAQKESGVRAVARIDAYVQSALTGILSNPGWNTVEAKRWLEMKNLNLEGLAVMSAIESILQVDRYLKGESLGVKEDTATQLELVPQQGD